MITVSRKEPKRVFDGEIRVGVTNVARCLDAQLRERGQRLLEAGTGQLAGLVDVGQGELTRDSTSAGAITLTAARLPLVRLSISWSRARPPTVSFATTRMR